MDAKTPSATWLHRLAILVVALTAFMIIVGAMVTTIRAGDTDPTWSWRFWEWVQRWLEGQHVGLRYELGHRVVGTVIGFAVIGILVIAAKSRAPRNIKNLAWLVLVAVVCQGVLGGVRVLVVSDESVQNTVLSATGGENVEQHRAVFAMAHGILAQITFTMTVLLALATSRSWRRSPPPIQCSTPIRKQTLASSRALIGLIFFQLGLGTLLRQTGLGIVQHISNAFIIMLVAVYVAMRAQRYHAESQGIRRVAGALAFITVFQIFLGFVAWYEMDGRFIGSHHASLVAVIRTTHVMTAATLLAMSVAYYLMLKRQLVATTPTATKAHVATQESDASQATHYNEPREKVSQ